MEKPRWHLRASRYIVDSPYMRLRVDDVELPNGTVVPNYYVRESRGYAAIVALTGDREVVLVRQYRYGSDAIHLEVPAGLLQDDEDPQACALRELAEETGYEVERCEPVGTFFHEPVRSDARAYVYIGFGARSVRAQNLDPTEHLEVELLPIGVFRTVLANGRIDVGGSIAAGYLALEKLRLL